MTTSSQPDLRSDKTKAEDDRVAKAITRERERCMNIIDEMRTSEAGDFKNPKCQGQRGQDRSDALYDAYCALRAAGEG